MASLNVSIQASCLSRTLRSNTYTAESVINRQDTGMSQLNLLTLDNVSSGGNCVTTIQANEFLPVMYSPQLNPSYNYYGVSFCANLTGNSNDPMLYYLQSQNCMYAVWADSSGACKAYTTGIPSTATAMTVYCTSDLNASRKYTNTINCTNLTSDTKTVAQDYTCNYKINEANIPYITGELVNHGTIPVTVLPHATTLTGDDLETTLPTKGAVVGAISGMARAISYNSGILALWGYGDDGKLYITSAVSLGVTASVDNQTLEFFGKSYPLT